MANIGDITADLVYIDPVPSPFPGQQMGMGYHEQLAKTTRKQRLIPGKGIRISENENGIIIEASNITINNLITNVTPLMTLAQVGTITGIGSSDGVYTIDFLAEAEDDEYTTIDSDEFIFVCNNMLAFSSYNNGDPILVYKTLVKTLDSGATDSTGAGGA